MNQHTAKYITIALSIVGALGGIWARFIVVEERQVNQLARLVELTEEIDRLRQHVSALEADRVLLERVHALELRLASLENSITVTATRKRRR